MTKTQAATIALIEAARMGNIEEIDRELQAGADIHAYQQNALRNAARHGHVDAVIHLCRKGARFDEAFMQTAFHREIDALTTLVAAAPQYGPAAVTVQSLRTAFGKLAMLEGMGVSVEKAPPAPRPPSSIPNYCNRPPQPY